jgi:hypothetical protein
MRTESTPETCAADTGAGVLFDGLGYPILLYARSVVPVRNIMLVIEPVSVQIGKPVPQERIALSGAK